MKQEVCYHHYSLTCDTNEIPSRFKDVKLILIAGCALRVEAQAKYLAENLFNGLELEKLAYEKLTKPSSRFALFQIGPVLLSNHGIGAASMSIALHELVLMCQQARIMQNITVIRFGTCGGIGVNAGTICVTNKSMDPLFQDFVELKVCMRLVRRDCVVDQKTALDLYKVTLERPNNEKLGDFEVRLGGTVATNDFYEEQGRTNGAICDHTLDDKVKFLERARDLGVINIEMESNFLFAMCHKLNISCGVFCVALVNRLVDDRVIVTSSQSSLFEQRLFWINLLFIKHKLSLRGTESKK